MNIELLSAWTHWVKLNPADDDQLAMALAIEAVLTENAELKETVAELTEALRHLQDLAERY